MKTAGIIILVVGCLGFIMGLIEGGIAPAGLVWVVVGAFLISKANKKEREKIEKDKWINNE